MPAGQPSLLEAQELEASTGEGADVLLLKLLEPRPSSRALKPSSVAAASHLLGICV